MSPALWVTHVKSSLRSRENGTGTPAPSLHQVPDHSSLPQSRERMNQSHTSRETVHRKTLFINEDCTGPQQAFWALGFSLDIHICHWLGLAQFSPLAGSWAKPLGIPESNFHPLSEERTVWLCLPVCFWMSAQGLAILWLKFSHPVCFLCSDHSLWHQTSVMTSWETWLQPKRSLYLEVNSH